MQRDILAPNYGLFSEGLNAPDLKRAKEPLEQLN